MTRRIASLIALLALAACSSVPLGPATSTDPGWASGRNKQLETPNSLPPGFTTNHPFAPATGQVTRRVGM